MAMSHWAYIRLIGENEFSGGGVDLRGYDFKVDDLNGMDTLLRVLEREVFLTSPEVSAEND